MAGLRVLWAGYEAQLAANPLRTKMCTSFSLMGLGDVLAQTAFPYLLGTARAEYEPKRTACMAVLGLMGHAPYFHYWYRWLDTRFTGSTLKVIAPKLCLELGLAGPGYLCIVLSYTTLCKTGEASKILPKIRQDFVTMYGAGVAFHGVVQAFNFRFVPSRQRILYDNCVSLVWKTFLSFYSNKGQ